MKIKYFFFIALFLLSNQSCVNKDGNPVDWFFTILYPISSKEDKKLVYVYVDDKLDHLENHEYDQVPFPPKEMSSDSAKLIEWNTDSSKGFIISKGLNSNAFVLHTLQDLTSYYVAEPHSFFCISINDANVKKLLSSFHLLKIDLKHNRDNDLIRRVSIDKVNSSTITDQITRMETLNKKVMILFTKTTLTTLLPYQYVIRNYYKESFYVKSSKKRSMTKICENEKKILNVNSVIYEQGAFQAEEDNCKWAVSIFGHINCFSDLDFENDSRNKGGNTLCFSDDKVSAILRGMINSKEDCGIEFDNDY